MKTGQGIISVGFAFFENYWSHHISMMDTKKNSILVIDDDPEIRELLQNVLEDSYQVYLAEDGQMGFKLATELRPNLILLDLKMPKISGFDVCKNLKSESITQDTPVIVLTANSEIPNLVKAFDLGADDFIEKPFRAEELFARISSKIKKKQECPKVEAGDITLDSASMEVSIAGKPEAFSVLEFNLLRFFVENKNQVVSRVMVLDRVWNSVSVGNRTVDTHIVSLRKKISASKCELKTIYGAGYKLSEPTESSNSFSA